MEKEVEMQVVYVYVMKIYTQTWHRAISLQAYKDKSADGFGT